MVVDCYDAVKLYRLRARTMLGYTSAGQNVSGREVDRLRRALSARKKATARLCSQGRQEGGAQLRRWRMCAP